RGQNYSVSADQAISSNYIVVCGPSGTRKWEQCDNYCKPTHDLSPCILDEAFVGCDRQFKMAKTSQVMTRCRQLRPRQNSCMLSGGRGQGGSHAKGNLSLFGRRRSRKRSTSSSRVTRKGDRDSGRFSNGPGDVKSPRVRQTRLSAHVTVSWDPPRVRHTL